MCAEKTPGQVYLVGGAVRDELLGRPVSERDWVVVGATPKDMLRRGFKPVGRSFPVFLHPKTGEEYALARTERKTAPGYHGFTFHTGPGVTLADDLRRRDLTINAIARDSQGKLIDPCGGRADLDARVLRHVSPAFAEDPVRILRVARFAARFAPLGFRVHTDTAALMRKMSAAGEVAALTPERVWRELERALTEPAPSKFFAALCDARAAQTLGEEAAMFVCDQAAFDPDALDAAASDAATQGDGRALFTLLVAQAARRGVSLKSLCRRLHAPTFYNRATRIVPRVLEMLEQASAPTPATLLSILEAADALRRPEHFERLLAILPRLPLPDNAQATAKQLAAAQARVARLNLREATRGLDGADAAQAARRCRLEALEKL